MAMEGKLRTVETCVQWLDEMLMPRGSFRYSMAVKAIKAKLKMHHITQEDYLYLFEACFHRNKDGHYRNSLIYRKAETGHQKGW